MKFLLSTRARREYERLQLPLQKAADKQFGLLLRNLQHPSLRAKKYDEARDIWQARISRGYRFYFKIHGDTYHMLAIVKHPS